MFTLDQVVPWGRSFEEYRRMFALRDAELRLRILGCGDGPASFNAEGAARDVDIVSCDPLYQWGADEIGRRIAETRAIVLDETRRNADTFVWRVIPSLDDLEHIRMRAMETFLEHFRSNRTRYVAAALPSLPFANASFDLALCSHFLFLYSKQFSADFHIAALAELARVAQEVRVFPVLALDGTRSEHLPAVTTGLRAAGYTVAIQPVPYEFQRGGNEMLRIVRRAGTA
jgi:hypothetical protein